MFKAWNAATPAQLSGSSLLLVKTKQTWLVIVSFAQSFDIRCVGNKIHIVESCTLHRVRKMIVRGTQSSKPIFMMILIFKIFASKVNFFRKGIVADHQPIRDVRHLWTGQGSIELSH